MNDRQIRVTFRLTLSLLIASLALAAAAGAENRLPANRTYLAAIQGLQANDFAVEFGCIVFHRDGRLVAGEDVGDWRIVNWLTVSRERVAVAFNIDVRTADTPPADIEIEGLCWLEDRGPIHSLSCSAWGHGDGAEANFALTARPLGGETSPEALASCRAMAEAWNAAQAAH